MSLIPSHPTYLVTPINLQASNTLIGQKVGVWIDMYKAELTIQQLLSGTQSNGGQLDDFIVSTEKFLTSFKMFTLY
jgi:hypothetical protein